MKGWDYADDQPGRSGEDRARRTTPPARKTEKHQKRMMGEVGKLLGDTDGKLDVKDYERTVATLMSGGSDPRVTHQKP